jgi:hypothetical protein
LFVDNISVIDSADVANLELIFRHDASCQSLIQTRPQRRNYCGEVGVDIEQGNTFIIQVRFGTRGCVNNQL